MMQFSIGDKVMHPQYGPGEISAVQHRELVEGFEHYYVIELLGDRTTLYVPIRKIDELGLRPVMSRARLARVLDTLQSAPRRLSKDYKVRQERIREKLATARPIKVAEAVRDLTERRRHKNLTKGDRALLKQARELLAAEVAMVNETEIMNAHQTMDAALKGVVATELSEPSREKAPSTRLISDRQDFIQDLLRKIREA